MVSFFRLAEQMRLTELRGPEEDEQSSSGPLLDSEDDSLALSAVRSGMQLRKKDCGDFWEDFITICGNAEALSELLDIPKEKVTGWPEKIRESIDKVKSQDDQTAGDSDKSEMIPTGEDMPAAPNEHPGADIPDTRPFPS